jgi:hypothetical protein
MKAINTRIMYDNVETKNQIIYSEAPMKYMTNQINQTKYIEAPNMRDVSQESTLRAQPTRLNEIFRDNTVLQGTAPFKARNDGPIDDESALIFGEYHNDCVRKDAIEDPQFGQRFIDTHQMETHIPLPNQVGVSTRNLYRNKCFRNK